MSQSQLGQKLLTPIYIKPTDDTPWPEDPVFYFLTKDGLFLCRNNQFYKSAVPAPRWPGELAEHEAFLRISYPKISQKLLEAIVGYFGQVADEHDCESAVILLYNKRQQCVKMLVPSQTIEVYASGRVSSGNVKYELDQSKVPADSVIIGDAHCHVNGSAYCSWVDKDDELHRPGLHLVVGKINHEPPEFHIEAVTDGQRFTVAESMVLEGYEKRSANIPATWMDKITFEKAKYTGYQYQGGKSARYQPHLGY